MAKQANRMMIGTFVVIAAMIMVASLVVFGSGNFFQKTEKYVLYFDGSIKGLNVGAPVLFQGVTVGSVISAVIRADRSDMKIEIPVIIEVSTDKFEVVGAADIKKSPEHSLATLIDAGMRAVLTSQSMITGQLMIEIDFFPKTPAKFRNVREEYPEIPTIPSATERLAQTFNNLNLDKIQRSLERTLSGIDRLINAPELKAGISAIKGLLNDTRHLVGRVDSKLDPLLDDLGITIRDVNQLVNHADGEMISLSSGMDKMVAGFSDLARETDVYLEQLSRSADQTMASIRDVSSQDAPVIVELENTLQDVANMARAFRQLADYLEQHPEALLQGKGDKGGE